MKTLGLLVLAVVVLASGCATPASKPPSGTSPATSAVVTPETVEVIYRVRGAALKGSVTMQTPTGSTQLVTGMPMLNEAGNSEGRAFTFAVGEFVYLGVQGSPDATSVECIILSDGVPISDNIAKGSSAIATCKGTASAG